jgi:hypothetical protein
MPSVIAQDLSQPGTHALVIGVSQYLHFSDGAEPTPEGAELQMEQLSAAARSASEVASWLLEEYRCPLAPLRSLRVLLSPAPGEQIASTVASKLPAGDPMVLATRANVEREIAEFRHACDSHAENVAFVYVAGHGVQLTNTGAVVLLSDVGCSTHLNRLQGAIDMASVHAGMRYESPARTQFWFVDACRQRPAIARRFETLEGALKLDVPINQDTDCSPLFLAATTGTSAYARAGGLTLFCEALLWALRGGCAAGPEDEGVDCWHVPVTSLVGRLPQHVKALAATEGAEQSADTAGKIAEGTLQYFDAAPKADLRLDLMPPTAEPVTRATLKLDDLPVFEDLADWPVQQRVDAGLYLLKVSAQPPYVNREMALNVMPPSKSQTIKVTP